MRKAELDFKVICNVLRDVELDYLDLDGIDLNAHEVFNRVLNLAVDFGLEHFTQLSSTTLCFGDDRFKEAIDKFFSSIITVAGSKNAFVSDAYRSIDTGLVEDILKEFRTGFDEGAVLLVMYQNDLVGIAIYRNKTMSDRALFDFYRFKATLLGLRDEVTSDGLRRNENIVH